MRRVVAFAMPWLLSACGDEPKAPPAGPPAAPPVVAPSASPTAEGAVGARAAVDAYLAAARVPDEAAMLALGTPEWQEKEKRWARGFTLQIARRGYALKKAEVREPEVAGDEASVSVRAVFDDEGRDDNEGMRFSLVRRDGRWRISDLR